MLCNKSIESTAKDEDHDEPNLNGDRWNILLLLLLFILQSIPRGLANAIPLILQNRQATYHDQAEFSLVTAVYTVKLLWAPIIDCVYSKKIGRRKSWVMPMLYFIAQIKNDHFHNGCAMTLSIILFDYAAVLLLITSFKVADWWGSEDGVRRPNIHLLTLMFGACILCSSIQDVAVDAWSLTMLQKRNIGYLGTCNNVGFAVGQLLGFVSFIILGSKEFSNYFRSVPQDRAFVEYADFVRFWSVVLAVSTTLIFVFKRDNSLDNIEDDHECKLSLRESYGHLWKMVKCQPVRKVCYLSITCLTFFAPVYGVTNLKLIDTGIPRDKVALLNLPTIGLLCILPFTLSRFMSKRRSLNALLAIHLFRLIFDLVFVTFMYFTPLFKNEDGAFPPLYYGFLLFFYNVDHLAEYAIWILIATFFSHVSDPKFGAMYTTLFDTMTHVGSKWSLTTSLELVHFLTFKSCTKEDFSNPENCVVIFDGLHTEILLATLLGFVWWFWARRQARELIEMDASAFRVT